MRKKSKNSAKKSSPKTNRAVGVLKGVKTTLVTFVVASLVLFVVAAGVYLYPKWQKYFSEHPLLPLKHVAIEWQESSKQVKELASTQAHLQTPALLEAAQFKTGKSIFDRDLAEARADLMALPWIKEAIIRRKFPSTIIITLALHEPVALLSMQNFYYVNAKGDIFKVVGPRDPNDFPILSGLTQQDLQKRPLTTRKGLIQGTEIIKQIKGLGSKGPIHIDDVSELIFDPKLPNLQDDYPDEFPWFISLVLTGGRAQIFLSQGQERLAEDFAVLDQLRAKMGRDFLQADRIDLRFDGQVIVLPKSMKTGKI